MGAFCFGSAEKQPEVIVTQKKPQLHKVDEVKFKLKKARDTIKNFMNLKNKDLSEIEQKITEKVPAFKQTGNKKQLIPLLTVKKGLLKQIDSGQVRMKLINTKLDEVQMQQINIETINVLDQSNQYIKQVQETLEQKDWRRVLDQTKQKYEMEWPDDQEQVQNDPAFQAMWKELGGDLAVNKVVQKKNVNVQINKQLNTEQNKKKQAYA